MNIEEEVKTILKGDYFIEDKIKFIQRISNFREEDLLVTIKKGGENAGDIYSYLIYLDKQRRKRQ